MTNSPNLQYDPETIAQAVQKDYDLPTPMQCELIRRGFNDHYLLTTPTGPYVFRVYFNGKYYIESESDFRFELDLLDFLSQKQIPVACAVPRRDGSLLGTLPEGDGVRWCALFRYAAGKEREPMTARRAERLGETMARFHQAADAFQTPYRRYHFNLEYLLNRPMRLLHQVFAEQGKPDALDFLDPHIASWREQVGRLPTFGPAYGIIHGDPHGGNVRFTAEDDLTLFDFDHGGYGWRSYDMSVCKGGMSAEAWEAFLCGYQTVRLLAPVELEVIPIFQKIRPIWDIGDILAMEAVWGVEEKDAAWCDGIRERLRKVTA